VQRFIADVRLRDKGLPLVAMIRVKSEFQRWNLVTQRSCLR